MNVKIDTRLKDWDRSELKGKVAALLASRRLIVQCGWRDDPYAYYHSLLPRGVREALTAIEESFSHKFKALLNYEFYGIVNVERAIGGPAHVRFDFGNVLRPSINPGWHGVDGFLIKQAHPAWSALMEFCHQVEECIELHSRITALVDHVAETCNTYGQIHRVWPELLPTIGGAKVNAAESQKRRSSLPQHLMIDNVVAHRDKYTIALAQGALMQRDCPIGCWLVPDEP